MAELLIFEPFPVQYRAPMYQQLADWVGDRFEVVYGAPAHLRNQIDKEFGREVVWDTPLTEGYPNQILGNWAEQTRGRWNDIHGRGLHQLIHDQKPANILITGFNKRFDLAAYLNGLGAHVPMWLRAETQDEGMVRSPLKALIRSAVYRMLYPSFEGAFYFGELNRQHLLRHGFANRSLVRSPYSMPNPFTELSSEYKQIARDKLRCDLGIPSDAPVILFCGKLIAKKDPELLLRAYNILLERMPAAHIVFVGSGELEASLKSAVQSNTRIHFTGFVNQTALPDYYLMADVLCLPSRRAGETWGLVVNEALQAGCGVVMSNAVGCAPEFGDWDRVAVVSDREPEAYACALEALLMKPRDFEWCSDAMERYSIAESARALANVFFKNG